MAEEKKKIKRASDRRRERSARHEAKIKEYQRQMTPKTLELHKQYFRKPTAKDLYKARLRKEKDERIEKENKEGLKCDIMIIVRLFRNSHRNSNTYNMYVKYRNSFGIKKVNYST